MMELKLDVSRPYGIVLEGGGAKGAYQVGAWKALREAGLNIRGIAGASVGALNGALMCMDDLETAQSIWEEISYSKVMEVDDELMGEIKRGSLTDVDLKALAEHALRVLRDGGFDVAPLRKLIAETVDEEKIRRSGRELYVTAFSLDEKKELVLDVASLPEGEIGDALLASAYFPAFKNEKLGGKRFLDGGSLNNVPVDVLIEKGYEDIIIIRIYGLGFDTEKFTRIPDHVRVSRIAPRENLGGILEFDKVQARKNMELGYMDAKRLLYGLEGRLYYFDAPRPESYYFGCLMEELEQVKAYLAPELGEEAMKSLEGYRVFTEKIFPELAKKLKLDGDWDYKDLYLAVLEEWAKDLGLNRFQIYTPEEVSLLVKKMRNGEESSGKT